MDAAQLTLLVETLRANSTSQAAQTAESRVLVDEIRTTRTSMDAATAELREVVAIGRDRIIVADERRKHAAQVEAARIGALARAGKGLWEVTKNPFLAILMALAGYLSMQYLGATPPAPVSAAQTIQEEVTPIYRGVAPTP